MKKSKLLTLMGVGITGIALTGGVLSIVSAHPSANQDNVLAKVISKLGLNVTTTQLQDALDSSRQEVRTEQLTVDLSTAVAEGKLTQEQADLAKKVDAWMESNKPAQPTKLSQTELDSLTVAEARAKMEEQRTTRESEMAARKTKMLTELGITEDQLTDLQNALRDANVRGVMIGEGGKKGGEMGKGRGMGGRMDDTMSIPQRSQDK